jgi:hypothetical protein
MIPHLNRAILLPVMICWLSAHVAHARLQFVLPAAVTSVSSDPPSAAGPVATFGLSLGQITKTISLSPSGLSLSVSTGIQPAVTPAAQASALLAGKTACLQDLKGKLASWTAGTDICSSWEGVKCNKKTGLVKELALEEMGLSVSIIM